jgi:hypothetical protein
MVTTRLPSGENSADTTSSVCPSRVKRSAPEAASQSFAVLSSLAVTTRLPSGESSAVLTSSVCPSRVTRSAPEAASQSFAVFS